MTRAAGPADSFSAKLYSQPLRVYLLLGVLALAGIWSGLKLPISLFPNSAKPEIGVWINYGSSTATEFQETYGNDIEAALNAVKTSEVTVEAIKSTYWNDGVVYNVSFTWGSAPEPSRKEVDAVINSWRGRLPAESADSLSVWTQGENAGFYAASFYSDRRGLNEVYELLEAALKSRLAAVSEADQPEIWNPERKEIKVELKPDALAALGLLPRDVEYGIANALKSQRGGNVMLGTQQLVVELPRQADGLDALSQATIPTAGGRGVHLADVAQIDFAVKSSDSRIIKTSGASSVLVYAAPKAGGNVKKMAEDVQAAIDAAMKTLPPDVQYKVLVDPSRFIQAAVANVFHEVALGALLAVSVLFFFIGSFKNVATAAIEIPLSIVLAFILMKILGVNINLISLGGLALSAGMNVDGSVVVMENIFRHFGEAKGRVLGRSERLALLVTAVSEVKLPLIASTIASLVVFLPLTFTSSLSYAILGDLAKAVVFSHGFSAIVALILVPTVRYQLMSREGATTHPVSPFEPFLARVDRLYVRVLAAFIGSPLLKWGSYLGLGAVLAALIIFVLPRLPREVIGTPDSDMVNIVVKTSGNTVVKQMETQSDEVERQLLAEFGDKIDYTFTQISVNRTAILAHLRDKNEMQSVWTALEKRFTNTPVLRFFIEPWNPSELPIPHPAELRVAVRGGDLEARRDAALAINDLLEGSQSFGRVSTDPYVERAKGLTMRFDPEQWTALRQAAPRLTPGDLVDISRVASQGRRIARMSIAGRDTDVMLRYPAGLIESPEDLKSFAVGINGKVVPLGALLPFTMEERPPPVYRENLQDLFVVYGRLNKSDKLSAPQVVAKAQTLLADWQAKQPAAADAARQPVIAVEDAGKDITEAIEQLGLAIAASILLIFMVLLLQFGSVVESLLVLVAVPLGFIGVIAALALAGSTLSLNAALGVILLNGIAVNNSIIMVDFIRRLTAEGHPPRAAARVAAQKRLRPILITSLTTILGMLPIALGFGEGGRILQPLGIAVSGGLWISMGLTLLLVPALHVSYLEWKQRREARKAAAPAAMTEAAS